MPAELPAAIEARFDALQVALELHARSTILRGGARDFGRDWDEAMRAIGRLKSEVWKHLQDEATVRRAVVALVVEPETSFEPSTDESDEIHIETAYAQIARDWEPRQAIETAFVKAHAMTEDDCA